MSYIPMQKGIIYGPIASKRLRRSLGVNLLPVDKKVCTFNCVYCHYGPTHVGQYELPSAEEVVSALEEYLQERPLIDYITFAGNGEPTLHPDFLEIVKAVRSVRDRLSAGTPIALLSNSTQLDRSDIVEAAGLIDFPAFKLDAGDGDTLHAVNRPVASLEIEEVIEWLCRLPSPIIQTVVLGGKADTSGGPALQSWFDAIGRIRPRLIQLYSPDRPIVSQEVVPVPPERLRQIGRYVKDSLGFDARVF
jgi:wyosine [tRNA(Phe)-imidazoG37] synthetase (radical SAM superfamily)